MKALKLILTTLLFLVSFAAEAQNVVIYKDGNIVREYTAEQVDSVVYVPAKEVKYYYYVGWEEVNESNLATLGHEIINFDSTDKGATLVTSEEWTVNSDVREVYYYVIPEGTLVYDNTFNADLFRTDDDLMKTFSLHGILYKVYKGGFGKSAGNAAHLIKS